MAHDESSNTCACGGSCSCQTGEQEESVYLTREEYVAEMEAYLIRLKKEIISVEDELAQLKETA